MAEYKQLVTPDPNIPCRPGWCLQYVRQAFGAPAVEPTATAGWNSAKYRHTGQDFPEGVWVPLWFSLANEPAGHVVLRAPDGSIYSTSHPTWETATHHPNLADLYRAYSRYNPLTYLGWSEDISGVRIIEQQEVKDGFDMADIEDLKKAIREVNAEPFGTVDSVWYRPVGGWNGRVSAEARIAGTDQAVNDMRSQLAGLRALVEQLSVAQGVTIDYGAIARAVADEQSKRLAA